MTLSRQPTDWQSADMMKRIKRRYAAERRFKAMGAIAVLISVAFLAFLLLSMASSGARGFMRTEIKLPIDFPASSLMIDPAIFKGSAEEIEQKLAETDFEGPVLEAAGQAYGADGAALLSETAWIVVRDAVQADPGILSRKTEFWVPASDEVDSAYKGEGEDAQLQRIGAMKAANQVRSSFNLTFLTGADATDPTMVGIWGAFKGSLLTMIVTLLLAFPVGVFSAIYLEEYAPRNRWTDIIEVSINNLAAVPSIIFGLLGLAVFLTLFPNLRSAPVIGGMTLALMTMPVIVIAGRNAIKSVPPSIRDAALGIGASPVQVVFHHVLPLALPGILTGTIIGMARALGETAPLLMVGMRAFISSPPGSFTEPATVLPVQIFLWSDEVSRGFVEKTSAAIIVLLVFLLAMNGLAIYLRNRFETRW
ncbi:MAG TPA: phosphate ABC transporter permease PstA [Sphingobium sp.]|nr:phosphate ABC transporter permease PstA [Sphingobium sp.]